MNKGIASFYGTSDNESKFLTLNENNKKQLLLWGIPLGLVAGVVALFVRRKNAKI